MLRVICITFMFAIFGSVFGQNQYNRISVKVPVPIPMNEQGFPLSNAIRCHITANLHNGSTWSECDETAWGLTRNCPNDRGEALCVSSVDMVKHTIAKGCMTRDALGVLELISPSQADVCRVSKKYPTQLYCTCAEDNCNSEMLLMERQCYHCRDCGMEQERSIVFGKLTTQKEDKLTDTVKRLMNSQKWDAFIKAPGCNRQIEYVDKRHCLLSTIPDEILRYPRSLEELLLDANKIRDLPKGLFRLAKLRRLSLSDNEIQRIPSDILNFVNLVELDMSRNDIPDIPDQIKHLTSLQVADFSSNPIQKLPSGFVQLKSLTTLGLNDMSLTYLPPDFGNLSNLESLELRENLLRTLPESLSQLTRLQRLDIGDNEIDELPVAIGDLPSLQELWLDHNQLTTLPKSIGNLKKLMCLDVSENHLDELPEEISGLVALTDLHLSRNYLERLPDGIGALSKLTIFKVDQNHLLRLNPAIGKCASLQEIVLTENRLVDLPRSLGNCVEMTNLNVDRNALSAVPSEIGRLTKLGVLSMRDNRLEALPAEIGDCVSLAVLDVSGNRLKNLPITLTKLSLKAIWLSENQSQSLLKFQAEVDEETGEQVLTCYMLPQLFHGDETICSGRLYRANGEVCVTDNGIVSFDSEPTRRSSSFDNSKHVSSDDDDAEKSPVQREVSRSSVVKFDAEDNENDKETHFVRHNTPHPRELKTKAAKLLAKKGEMVKAVNAKDRPRDEDVVVEEEEEGGVEQEGEEDDVGQRRVVADGLLTSENREIYELEGNETALLDESLPAFEAVPAHREEVDSRVSVDAPTEETKEVPVDSELSFDSAASSYAERHVGFALEGREEDEEDDDAECYDDDGKRPQRLHRRDTPHHLKNKRINLNKVDEEKAADLIAQAPTRLSSEVWNTAIGSEGDEKNNFHARSVV
ncbi:unnamed protein product [Notodromas monacha]|uniref:Disease resistance R13L4/SHOC-2-like LRR domain-containing protein n=1 Tax=Notodromas monacha TaxID=399045 RepID=A0A7R9G9S8_9CRUS|nr:unnamed protein product [Notodromas monacha]CAG0914558.1 unnamed protein product [Notodromas monacha]